MEFLLRALPVMARRVGTPFYLFSRRGENMMHTPILVPKLFEMMEKSIGLDISIYVRGVQDAMMDGVLVDFDSDFLYLQSSDSVEAWRLESLSGVVVFTPESEPKFEIVFGGIKNKKSK
jgi:hypothetical protein